MPTRSALTSRARAGGNHSENPVGHADRVTHTGAGTPRLLGLSQLLLGNRTGERIRAVARSAYGVARRLTDDRSADAADIGGDANRHRDGDRAGHLIKCRDLRVVQEV